MSRDLGYPVNIILHLSSRRLPHRLGYVTIDIKCETRRSMAQIALYCLDTYNGEPIYFYPYNSDCGPILYGLQ